MPKKKRSTANLSSEEPAPQPHKRPTISGTDLALSLPTVQGTSLDLSYWDLWFSIVAVLMHDGDLDRLADEIKAKKGEFFDRHSTEHKRCHIRDLKRRLIEASIIPADIVLAAGDLAKKEKRRAIDRMTQTIYRERDLSEPMIDTPRKRRSIHALRGYWDKFPDSPEFYAKKIGGHFRHRRYYSKNESFRVSETLDNYVQEAKKLIAADKAAQAQSLLRGLMTVIIELMQKTADSFGRIGMSFDDGFTAYLKIPLGETGIDERVFFADLLDFLIWEDYEFIDGGIKGYFRRLTEGQADLCVGHLRHEVAALLDDDLDYQSEEALTFLGQVIAEQERFDEFEDLAKQMGSRARRRIIRLVDRAIKRQKKPLAIKVFEAALTKGHYLDFLTKKYEQLKRGHWSMDPKK